jgi:hypothetical protein
VIRSSLPHLRVRLPMLDRSPMARMGRPISGHVVTTVSLEPAQLQALRREAAKRARAEGRERPDVSAVVREAVEAWLRRGK